MELERIDNKENTIRNDVSRNHVYRSKKNIESSKNKQKKRQTIIKIHHIQILLER